MSVELLETIRQGDVGYKMAVEHHNRMISKAILNNTLVTDDGGSGIGSFALAKVHLSILQMCLKSLKQDLEESVVREQILRPMVAYNFGPDVPVPYFSLGPLEEREIEPLSRAAKNLVDAGIVAADDPWFKEFLGIEGSAPAPSKPSADPVVSRTRVDGDTNDGKVQVG
jgi:phage gp29-like protein